MRTYAFLPLLAILLATPAPGAPAPPAAPSVTEIQSYACYLGGNLAGSETVKVLPGGEREDHFSYNDRGRGADLTLRWKLGAGGVPVALDLTGHDYFKNPAPESFRLADGQASWKSTAEEGRSRPAGPAFYLPLGLTPEAQAVLARALLAAPGGKLPLLPAGEAAVERLATLEVAAGGKTKKVEAVALKGLLFTPVILWLEADGTFFGSEDGFETVIREGWDGALPALEKAEKAALERWEEG
ncbi:MAG TPA: hypothetical protein VMM92_15345, partial [Thermoanaerobaculia bacterium]|nr:hypothetical protein [Thermoanaerobaculia bacterium]